MKKSNLYGLIALALTLVMIFSVAVSANASSPLSAEEIDGILNTTTDNSKTANPVTEAVSKVSQSVVVVRNYQRSASNNYYGWGWGYGYGNGNGNGQTTERLAGIGSGTVITSYGHILTNYHVIEDASKVTVYDGKNEYEAMVVNYNATKDIAVLLVPGLNIPAVELGDSDQLLEGETAIVIGNPLGEDYMRSITVGVVSALDRELQTRTVDRYGRRENITNTMIQVDAAINSGNSGGGMFNILGQLMGIPSAYSHGSYFSGDAESIGWCIPINEAKPLIREALEKYDGESAQPGTVTPDSPLTNGTDMTDKPRLGITMTTLSDTNTAVVNGVLPRGCIVREVDASSPAAAAGIQVGDIIVEIDGVIITDASELQQEILKHGAGDTVSVKLYRAATNPLEAQYISDIGEGEYIDLQVTLQVVAQPSAKN